MRSMLALFYTLFFKLKLLGIPFSKTIIYCWVKITLSFTINMVVIWTKLRSTTQKTLKDITYSHVIIWPLYFVDVIPTIGFPNYFYYLVRTQVLYVVVNCFWRRYYPQPYNHCTSLKTYSSTYLGLFPK